MRAHRAILGAAAALALTAAARDAADDWIDATPLPPLAAETSAEMVDRDGTLLRAWPVADGLWRLRVTPEAVDPGYRAMLIAYEDKRFWRHPGIDPLAVARAGWQAVKAGRRVSGASTLTMQVARLLEDGPTGSWRGKLRQVRVALALERRLSKTAILELYLQHAPFGGNLEGAAAAAWAWFGKPARRLTPAEAALLVALPQSPTARRPDRDPVTARAARDRVLARAVAAGVLDAAEARAAARSPVPTARHDFPALAPHLGDRLRRADPAAGRHATTLDAGVQGRMEALAVRALQGHDRHLSVALIAADHRTGAILAQVGSAHYAADDRAGFVDMTRALRSPGSTLKPLIYGLAFDSGLAHPETTILDRPTAFGAYAPQNFDGGFRGPVRLRAALQTSLNVPAVKLTEALGPATLMAALRRSGARPVLPGGRPGLAVALGGVGVTLHDLVQSYAALARGGTAVALTATPAPPAEGARVLSPEAAWHVGDILAGVAPPPGAPRNGLAYKTGTSYGHRDAWAVGWDGRHVVGVWLGRPDGTPVPGAFGADLAAPLLFDAFARIVPQTAPLPPAPPGTLTVQAADLPQPLRRFGGDPADGEVPRPDIAFPPDGARLHLGGAPLVAKVRDGRPPFTWLVNGRPAVVATGDREVPLPDPGAGYATLSVVDAAGRAARATVRLD
ncbi:penicillin-binding protein 1C [Rhodobacteraceae bacterium CCMM004]|nr:penicillin-binding protein 1C [Rhodobacteraceae bacterium CCMM004]